MITLDGIDLGDLIFDNEFAFSAVDSRVDFSLGGTPIIFEQPRTGRPINLVGDENSGWLKRDVIQLLSALAAIPGGQYMLDYEGTIFNVRFRNEEQPVIIATPLQPTTDQDPEDYYNNITIKLMEI